MSAQPGHTCLLDQVAQPAAAQPGIACLLEQSIAVARRLHTGLAAPWQLVALARTRVTSPMQITAARDHAAGAPWHIAHPRRTRTRSPWGITRATDTARRTPWHRYTARTISPATVPWGITAARDTAAALPWGTYTGRPAATAAPGWTTPLAADTAAMLPWGVLARWQLLLVARIAPSRAAQRVWVLPWVRYSRPVDAGWGVVIEDGVPPTNEDGTIVVPRLRSYLVLNNVSLMRVSNGLTIPCYQVQVEIDRDTWGWGWSAPMHARQLADLERDDPDEPVELEAHVNGIVWRLLVERIASHERFGEHRLQVSGRGIAAEIAAPRYPAQSRDNVGAAVSAQQLAAAALTLNGAPLGWALDWQIADWLVPAGAWVHHGTPMDAVQRIAQAAGGYVQADPLTRTLQVLPGYPLLPWEWSTATPDFILPADATTVVDVEYLERPDYNAVYVSGTAIGGVLGHIKRTGSAGDLPAEMIVDPLVTHIDAARGRGCAVLGDTGRQEHLAVVTPILDDIGLYAVGSLIEFQHGPRTRRGIVRSVSVRAEWPRVRQTITVECHG